MDEVSVGRLTDIADGDYKIFALDHIEVGIFRTGSKVLAYENVCPHAGGPVCQGKIFNQVEEIITPDKKSGIGDWSEEDIVGVLTDGHTPDFDFVSGAMAEIVRNTARLSEADRQAIAVYLESVPVRPLP